MRNKGSYVEPGESLGRSSDPLAPITRHVRIEKNGARGHRCLTCRPPKVFLNTLDLKAHRASKHDNEKHSCRETEFDLTLNNSRSRRYHVENHEKIATNSLKSSGKRLKGFRNSTNEVPGGLHTNQRRAAVLAQEQGQPVAPANMGPALDAMPLHIAGGRDRVMPNWTKNSQKIQSGVKMDNQGGRPTGLNQQIFQMPGGQTRSQNGLPTHPSDLTQADQQKVMELAQKLAASCPEPQKNHYRTLVQTRFAQRAQEDTAQGKDPVLIWFQHQAFQGLTKNIAMQRQQRQLKDNMPPNMNPQAQATMQASREQISPAMMETAIIPGANGNYGQFNTIESTNQQKVGILAQEQGQTVVSTSNDPALSASPHPVTKGQGQEMPMQEVHPHHNQIKQKQMATAMARLTNMRQTQELLLKLPSTFRLNTMSSSLSTHHTISKDFTGGEDARNASLFADLGARLNGCPQASSRNKPKM